MRRLSFLGWVAAAIANHVKFKIKSFIVWDWGILVCLAAIDLGLYFWVKPYKRFVGRAALQNESSLNYPLKNDTIPFWVMPFIAVGIPVAVMELIKSKIIPRLHDSNSKTEDLDIALNSNLVRGLLFAVLLSGVLTDALKNAVGRPRPDFLWRCFPDGNQIYDGVTGEAMCSGQESIIVEGHKSFPSGHASWSFAGLGFLSLYLYVVLIKTQSYNKHLRSSSANGLEAHRVTKVFICLTPSLLAIAICVTRVDDYMHHWQDVLIGGTLGMAIATLSFHGVLAKSHIHEKLNDLFTTQEVQSNKKSTSIKNFTKSLSSYQRTSNN